MFEKILFFLFLLFTANILTFFNTFLIKKYIMFMLNKIKDQITDGFSTCASLVVLELPLVVHVELDPQLIW